LTLKHADAAAAAAADDDDDDDDTCMAYICCIGPHKIDVTYEGLRVPKSPFTAGVVPGCDPSKVKVYGPGQSNVVHVYTSSPFHTVITSAEERQRSCDRLFQSAALLKKL